MTGAASACEPKITVESESSLSSEDISLIVKSGPVLYVPTDVLNRNGGGRHGLIVDAITGLLPIISGAVTMIERAGLAVDASRVTGQYGVAAYLTSTYDYLTSIQEMMGSQYAIQADPLYCGNVVIRPIETLQDEAAVILAATPGVRGGLYVISDYRLTRAVPARITRPTIQSEGEGDIPPISIQTDDRLYPDSIEKRIGWPTIDIFTDKSLLDKTMVAQIAHDNVARLHKSDTDGNLTLTEDILPVWSLGDDTTACGRHIVVVDAEGAHDLIANMVTMGGRSMSISLDSIRPDNAIPLGGTVVRADNAQGSTDMPDTVYMYVRKDDSADNSPIRVIMSKGAEIQMTFYNEVDEGGYHHRIGYIEPSNIGYATDDAIIAVRIGGLVFPLPETHAWPGQALYIDARTLR